MHSLQIYQVCVLAVSWHLHVCKLICMRNWKQLIEAIGKSAFKSCEVICAVKDGKVLNLLQGSSKWVAFGHLQWNHWSCCSCFLGMLFWGSVWLRPLFWSSLGCQLVAESKVGSMPWQLDQRGQLEMALESDCKDQKLILSLVSNVILNLI